MPAARGPARGTFDPDSTHLKGALQMANESPTDVATTVKALLDAAQLKLSDEEFELFTRIYPAMRAGADSLYIPETRYEEPALIFDASWDE